MACYNYIMARKSKKKVEDKDKVTIEINFAGKVLRGEGASIYEAMQAIEKPITIFTKGTIKVVDGDRSVVRTWMPVRMKRFFRPLSQSIVAKELTYLLE